MAESSTGAVGTETAPAAETPGQRDASTQATIHAAPATAPPPTPSATSDGQEPDEEGEHFDAERARALIRKLRTEAKHATAAIKERDQLKAAQQAAADAQLSKEEQLSKRASQAEAERDFHRQELQDRINRYEIQLAAGRLGIVDPEAAEKLLDKGALEYDDEGRPKDLEKALRTLAKQRPWLTGATPTGALSTGNPSTRREEPGQRIYYADEFEGLEGQAFYQKHKDDINAAMREGRVRRR